MTDPAKELAEELCIAVRDVTFNSADLEAWIAGRARHEPELLAAAVYILAAWAPDTAEARQENANAVVFEHTQGRRREFCTVPGCGQEMAPKPRNVELGVVQKGKGGMCCACYSRERRAEKAVA